MADKVYISRITLPSGTTYDIKDAQAWADIEELRSLISSGVHYLGVSETPITDGSTTNPIIIGGKSVTATSGDMVIYDVSQFIFSDTDNTWHELGTTGAFKALAFCDTAEGGYTPAGQVTVGIVSSTNKTATVSTGSGETSYTPGGTVSFVAFENKTATVSEEVVPQGQSATYTPAGSISFQNSNVNAIVAPAGAGAITYTPTGIITDPNISIVTAGTTSTINNPTANTVLTGINTTAPTTSVIDNDIDYYSVANEVLTLKHISYNTGDSISTNSVTVKTGDASYGASGSSFTGNGVRLETANISVPATASFSGEGIKLVTDNISVPSSASFAGSGVHLKTGYIDVPSSFSGSFVGTSATITVGPPSGS